MQTMINRIFSFHLKQRSPRSTTVVDRRSGTPVRHRPDPMPRIRWYS
jgi:hypothetical protein